MLKSITCACQSQVYRNAIVQSIISERFVVHRRNFFLLSHNCLFSKNTRNFVDKSNRIEQQESFAQFWERHRQRFNRRNKAIAKWSVTLQCDKKEATRLVENETELFERNFKSTLRKAELLMTERISSNTILNNIWVLHIAESRLQTYLRAMHLWGIEECFEEFVLVLDLSPEEFFDISESLIRDKKGPYGNRVLYLAERLECSPSEVLSKMMRKKFAFMRSIYLFRELLDLYKEYGVKNEDILSDFTCLSTKTELVQERLEKLREIGFHPIKPWLARYEYKKFETAIKFFNAEKEAADYNSREGFLAAKMKVDLEQMTELKEQIQRKYPYFFRIRALTFMRKMKFFLSQGFVPEELLSTPFAFNFKISTLHDRIITLQKLGIEKPRLQMVVRNQVSYDCFLNALLAKRSKCSENINKQTDYVTSSNSEKNN